MNTVDILKNRDQEIQLFEKYIVQKAALGEPLQILEAGCGRKWPLKLSGVQHILTGIDLDNHALSIRKAKFNDLDEIIIGDLRSIELEANKYDVIYNSYVLEHIENARSVMENFYMWLKPSGILILKIPDRNTVYGFITRITPHWLHVYYRKYFRGYRKAGQPGFGPYPTFYDSIISIPGIHEFCKNNGFTIKEEYGQDNYLNSRGVIISAITKIFAKFLSLLSLGKLSWRYNDLTYILEKKA